MAGVSGFEPERTVLETVILPLYYTPSNSPVKTLYNKTFSKSIKFKIYRKIIKLIEIVKIIWYNEIN